MDKGKLVLLEFWQFVGQRKKWALAPLAIILLMMAVLLILSSGSTPGHYVYSLF